MLCVVALEQLYAESTSALVRQKAEGALWILQDKQSKMSPASRSTDGGHVFISYQWDSKPVVLTIRDRLRSAGYKLWIDEDDMSRHTYLLIVWHE